MAPKRRGRGKRNVRKDDKTKKQEELKILFRELDEFVNSQIENINEETESICEEITKKYTAALKNIPEECHGMTFKEIDFLQKKTPCHLASPKTGATSSSSAAFSVLTGNSTVNSFMSKLKSMNLQRTDSVNRKKYPASSVSSSNSAVPAKKTNSGGPPMKSAVSNASNVMGANRKLYSVMEQANSASYKKLCVTPAFKRTFGPQMKRQLKSSAVPVTPKFDPKTPLPSMLLRKPKAGETIMSMSGSPLQNAAMDTRPEKPAFLLTLDNGKVLNLADNAELTNTLKLDQKTKATLMSVQKKLAGILHL